MKSTLLFSVMMLLLLACNKNASDTSMFWQCDDNQQLDSATTAAKIVGSWQLIQQRNPFTGTIVKADSNVIVNFKDDSTFIVRENAMLTTQGQWKLYQFSSNMWALNLSSDNPYLYGAISFCDNKLLLTDSFVDGSDNLFESVK